MYSKQVAVAVGGRCRQQVVGVQRATHATHNNPRVLEQQRTTLHGQSLRSATSANARLPTCSTTTAPWRCSQAARARFAARVALFASVAAGCCTPPGCAAFPPPRARLSHFSHRPDPAPPSHTSQQCAGCAPLRLPRVWRAAHRRHSADAAHAARVATTRPHVAGLWDIGVSAAQPVWRRTAHGGAPQPTGQLVWLALRAQTRVRVRPLAQRAL